MNNNEQDFYCEEVLVGKVEITTIIETDHTLAYYHTNPYYEKCCRNSEKAYSFIFRNGGNT